MVAMACETRRWRGGTAPVRSITWASNAGRGVAKALLAVL